MKGRWPAGDPFVAVGRGGPGRGVHSQGRRAEVEQQARVQGWWAPTSAPRPLAPGRPSCLSGDGGWMSSALEEADFPSADADGAFEERASCGTWERCLREAVCPVPRGACRTAPWWFAGAVSADPRPTRLSFSRPRRRMEL